MKILLHEESIGTNTSRKKGLLRRQYNVG